jgi:L-serine dehydratase
VRRVEPDLARIRDTGRLWLLGAEQGEAYAIGFDQDRDLVLHRRKSLPFHPNGLQLSAFDAAGGQLAAKTYYSVGGGFVVDDDALGADRVVPDDTVLRYPFRTGAELLRLAEATGHSVSGLMLENELAWRDEAAVRAKLLEIWQVMRECVAAGIATEGVLPGGLKVRRRAPALARALRAEGSRETARGGLAVNVVEC